MFFSKPSVMKLLLTSLAAALYLAHDVPVVKRMYLFLQEKTSTSTLYDLGPGWKDRSLVSCAWTCLEAYDNCSSILFDSDTRFCIPGQGIKNISTSQSPYQGNLYVISCATTMGFSLVSFGSSVFCLGFFGPSKKYVNADADCTEKGAHLMYVKTLDMLNTLRSVDYDKNLWVGCHDMANQSSLILTEDGDSLSVSTTHVGNSSCVMYPRKNQDSQSNLLEFDDCNKQHHYVCEFSV